MPNADVALTLDEAVAEVMGLLTGLDLELDPDQDRYQAITRQLNRAMREVALEHEWSYYASTENIGVMHEGDYQIAIRATVRPRIIGNDAIRIINPGTTQIVGWAYFIPRDALHKYRWSRELKAAHTRSTVEFSRPFLYSEEGYEVHIPVMREPRMFNLPPQPEDPEDPLTTVPEEIREQLVDFDYPDLVIRKAAYLYAQTNPLWQPRVQTLEANYKDLLYALQERDTRHTDTPYQNEWNLGIEGDATGTTRRAPRPTADWQGLW